MIISIVIVFEYYLLQVYKTKLIRTDLKPHVGFKLNKNLIEKCDNQWFKLNRHVYFRPNLAFYYLDLKELKIFYEINANFDFKFKIFVKLTLNQNVFLYFSINNFKYFIFILFKFFDFFFGKKTDKN